MFNGLIRDIGEVESFSYNTLTIKSTIECRVGDSIACNGACLSVISKSANGFRLNLSNTSKEILALERFSAGAKIHLERALRLDSRIDGHILQGHIDAIGIIKEIKHSHSQSTFFIELESKYKDKLICILPRGSISIDGVSLSVGEVRRDGFSLTLIPLTLKDTLFATYKPNMRVNIETDMFVRNVFGLIKNLKNANEKLWQDIQDIQMMF